jgi:hypothetical protein
MSLGFGKRWLFSPLAMLIVAAFISSCGGGSGDDPAIDGDGGGGGGGDVQSITGESGNKVALTGTWIKECDPDLQDGESESSDLTFSGSTFTLETDYWYDSTTCFGTPDLTLKVSGSFVLENELIVPMQNVNVTATGIDILINTSVGTIYNPDVVSEFNANHECGYNDWEIDISKPLLDTGCGPDSNFKDLLYVDDTVDPDVLYSGDDEGPLDPDGYPTHIDSDTAQERL